MQWVLKLWFQSINSECFQTSRTSVNRKYFIVSPLIYYRAFVERKRTFILTDNKAAAAASLKVIDWQPKLFHSQSADLLCSFTPIFTMWDTVWYCEEESTKEEATGKCLILKSDAKFFHKTKVEKATRPIGMATYVLKVTETVQRDEFMEVSKLTAT